MYIIFCHIFLFMDFSAGAVKWAFAAFKQRKFVNRGFLNGPICPVYGFGVGFVVSLLMPYKSNVFFMYIASVIAVSSIEWITGFALEKIFHSRWWDYSDQPFNLNGYILSSVFTDLGCCLYAHRLCGSSYDYEICGTHTGSLRQLPAPYAFGRHGSRSLGNSGGYLQDESKAAQNERDRRRTA